MSDVLPSGPVLGQRLRQLRSSWDGRTVTQGQLASAFGVSSALISSWESGNAVPPTDRLRQYSRFFASHRSLQGRMARLLPAEELDEDETREQARIFDQLKTLRDAAREDPSPGPQDRWGPGGSFWYFPDGQAVTILCTPLSWRQILGGQPPPGSTSAQQYIANPTHPNAVYNLGNGDIDALVALAGHIRAENPSTDLTWMTHDRIARTDDLTGHVVILGGGDQLIGGNQFGPVGSFVRGLDLPIAFDLHGADQEFDLRFVVLEDEDGRPTSDGTERDIYAPRFQQEEIDGVRRRRLVLGAPVLEYDVAMIARSPNPLNASATVTMCSGLFSRGTYGAARVFTDTNLRARNERHLRELVDPDDFWMLLQVPVLAGERTMTPDLGRSAHRLRTSS